MAFSKNKKNKEKNQIEFFNIYKILQKKDKSGENIRIVSIDTLIKPKYGYKLKEEDLDKDISLDDFDITKFSKFIENNHPKIFKEIETTINLLKKYKIPSIDDAYEVLSQANILDEKIYSKNKKNWIYSFEEAATIVEFALNHHEKFDGRITRLSVNRYENDSESDEPIIDVLNALYSFAYSNFEKNDLSNITNCVKQDRYLSKDEKLKILKPLKIKPYKDIITNFILEKDNTMGEYTPIIASFDEFDKPSLDGLIIENYTSEAINEALKESKNLKNVSRGRRGLIAGEYIRYKIQTPRGEKIDGEESAKRGLEKLSIYQNIETNKDDDAYNYLQAKKDSNFLKKEHNKKK